MSEDADFALGEMDRRLANVVRFGAVSAVDPVATGTER